jgi:hypothetical protein
MNCKTIKVPKIWQSHNRIEIRALDAGLRQHDVKPSHPIPALGTRSGATDDSGAGLLRSFEFWTFELGSNFVFRISDLKIRLFGNRPSILTLWHSN